MSQRNKFKIAKEIIISLSMKLQSFKNDFPELLQFIEELETINFSLTHQLVKTNYPSTEVFSVLNSSGKQFEGLDLGDISNLDWINIYDGVDSKHSFINGMFASRLVGLDGYYLSDHISVGLMLILPGVFYPFHTHLVKEFYYCLCGNLLIQHDFDGEKFSLDEGKISITPEGKLHSLKVVGRQPVLLLYSWLGDLNAPIRIWEKIQSEKWQGHTWNRLPGQKWKKSSLQELSNKGFLYYFAR